MWQECHRAKSSADNDPAHARGLPRPTPPPPAPRHVDFEDHDLLDAPAEAHQESAIMEALEYADRAASLAWQAASDKLAVERVRMALRVAVELLEGIRLAPADGQTSTED